MVHPGVAPSLPCWPVQWETHPVTPDRFEDFGDVINVSRRSTHCWCLSHRLTAQQIEDLGEGSREQAARRLCERELPPGVVTYRKQGTRHLIEGAVELAAAHDAPAVEAYPVEPGERRMDLTMAFVGTRTTFERVGFEVIGTTGAVASKMPRLVMRRAL